MVDAASDEKLTIDVPTPLPDPTGNTRGTLPESVAATVRQGARRYQWTGPFTVPNPRFAGLGSGSEDVEMPTASPGGEGSQAGDGQDEESGVQYVMSNAPALPAAPKYSGSTLQEKREFMRAYQTYVHALSAFHTATTKPYIMPVSACIEERTCNLICMYELNKDPSGVSEAEWVAYFLEALKPEQEDYTAIDEAMKSLKLKTTFPDAKSRMGQLRADMHKILDQHNKEQKKLVQYLVAALEPENFREAIRKRLSLDQHKDMRKDVVSCYKWILELLMAYLQWNPSGSKPNRAPARPQNGPATTAASGTNRRQTPFSRPPQAATHWRKSDIGIPPAEPPQKGPRPPGMPKVVRQRPQVRPEEIDALIHAWKTSRSASKTHMRRVQATRLALDVPAETVEKTGARGEDDGTTVAHISDLPVPASLLDSGADDSLCSTTPLYPVGGGTLEVSRKVRFEEVTLETPAGPLMLRGLVCWIDENDKSHALTISRLVMKRLGYSTPKLLADAKVRSDEYHLDEMDLSEAADRKFTRMHAIMRNKTEEYFEADEVDDLVTTPSLIAEIDQQGVQAVSAAKVQEAREAGLPSDCVETLQQLLVRYCDIFRLAFGNDPPIKVPPLKIRLKQGARPVKAKARRYPPLHREYLEKHLNELLDHGLVYINHRSRWASAPRIVAKKQPGEYRMTVDTRAINVLTDPMLWPMTDLEADLASAEGSEDYFTLDWWRGYWQLPLDEESQELFTIITHRGMVTPTRVLMGSSDSVAYCQGVVEQIFGPLLAQEILAWLDDILGFAKTPAALMKVLEHVLTLCEQYGLKLHPSKCCFYTREALWCGKLISADGVRHSPQ
uniref:Reverse transcriptase domain-containing protein n=1 Tax=Phytophthora ramorum TaxID=164328 RepID=H3GWP3_PHYRM